MFSQIEMQYVGQLGSIYIDGYEYTRFSPDGWRIMENPDWRKDGKKVEDKTILANLEKKRAIKICNKQDGLS